MGNPYFERKPVYAAGNLLSSAYLWGVWAADWKGLSLERSQEIPEWQEDAYKWSNHCLYLARYWVKADWCFFFCNENSAEGWIQKSKSESFTPFLFPSQSSIMLKERSGCGNAKKSKISKICNSWGLSVNRIITSDHRIPILSEAWCIPEEPARGFSLTRVLS